MAGSEMKDHPTVAASDIARLANVGRAAVSNWRRRFPDFPKPVAGSSASPLYSLRDVTDWLTRHGKPFTLTPCDRIWQHLRGAVDDLRLGELVGYVGAFLVFHHREPERWRALTDRSDQALVSALTETLRSAVPELPPAVGEPDPQWVAIVRMVAEAANRHGPETLFDFLCERYLEVHSRRYSPTPPAVADLMVSLAEVPGGSVLDPACGTGTILLAAARHGATGLHGQDVDPTSALLTAARLLLRDQPAHVAVGDSLRQDAFAGNLMDAVVSNPPFGERSWGYDELTSDPRWEHGLPPRSESELAWVQHCLAHVKPGGRIVIMMPAVAASRRAGRRIRGNLLRSGALRAVISLPGNGAGAGGAPDLWVLQRPDGRHHARILVAAAGEPARAVAAVQAFLADENALPSGPCRSLDIIDLLDEEIDVSPQRHLAEQASGGVTSRFPEVRSRMLTATKTLTASLSDLPRPDQPAALPHTTVGELAQAGAVVIRQAPIKAMAKGGERAVLTVNDVRQNRPPTGFATPVPGSVVLEPGDVVLPVVFREPAVRVITEGGALLGPQLLLLRADLARLDPYFLAGFVRVAQSRAASFGAAGSVRFDVRRVALPRLPISVQRDYGESFRQLMDLERTIRETAELGEQLVRLGFAGLADGTLQPRSLATQPAHLR